MTNKITCTEVMARLYAYLDSEVDELTELNIDEHLDECRECFSRAEFEKRLRARVAQSGQSATTPPDVQHRLKELIQKF
jgi:mycothiol system anti-sigma-R factor